MELLFQSPKAVYIKVVPCLVTPSPLCPPNQGVKLPSSNFIIFPKFDSLVQRAKRRWCNKVGDDLDTALGGDQRRFWCQLKKHTGLGKKKSSTIPVEVLDGQRVVTNKEEVVEKWRKDFTTLLEAKEDFISHSDASEANKGSQVDCISSGGSEGTWGL